MDEWLVLVVYVFGIALGFSLGYGFGVHQGLRICREAIEKVLKKHGLHNYTRERV